MKHGMLGQSRAGKQSRGKLCKGEAFMNTPFTVWKRPNTLPKGQVKGATPRPPARAASQVRLGVWGLAPAKRQPNCNANSNPSKKRGYGGATPCTGKTLTKFDANQQFLRFSLDVKYSIFLYRAEQGRLHAVALHYPQNKTRFRQPETGLTALWLMVLPRACRAFMRNGIAARQQHQAA